MALIVAAAPFILLACTTNDGPSEQTMPATHEPTVQERQASTRQAVIAVCKEAVKDQLKSPASAQFADIKDKTAYNTDGWPANKLYSENGTSEDFYISSDGEPGKEISNSGSYSFVGKVDSQNSFGAMLRSTWVCSVNTIDGEPHGDVSIVVY